MSHAMPVEAETMVAAMPDRASDPSEARLEDLGRIVNAYHEVTEKLRRSHEALGDEVVRLRRALASSDAQLQRSRRLAALGEMAAGIAHEIRNPLTALNLYADLLHGDLGADAAELASARSNAAKIAVAVRDLDAIVNDVLTFARELKPRPAPVAVDALFRRVVESLLPAMAPCGVRISQRPAPALDVYADPDLLYRALVNLARNAADAMPDGGVVSLRAERADDHVALVVRDAGPGIARRDIDRIFNPFFTTRATGTGLGLAIVHRIVDAHGGSITVANDRGAVFTLQLPLDGPQEAAPGRRRTADSRQSAAPAAAGGDT